jgi:metal-responsive CopG/Arc/MetJ family transcriptional regulator
MARKNKAGIDPRYLDKERAALKRTIRKSVFFNKKELAAITEYCKRFGVRSRSALIRQATMEHILKELDENHPTLF